MTSKINHGLPPPGRRAGQRVSLVPTLRRLIHDYPAGIGIVKEFLQNADDAQATWLRVTFDERNHPAQRLPSSSMAPLMGPAILISSDQVFSLEDLERIQAIGEGSKALDAQKTGQFGVGFNTAYTVTDYPAFATRDLIRCFDPLEDAVAVDGSPGREWELADLWQSWPDWPHAFGIEPGRSDLDYTVFRLPLRSADQARPERLSQTPFTAADVDHVFKEVVEFGSALLLFTRNVLHIELQRILPDSVQRQVLKIRTTNVEKVRENRLQIRLSVEPEAALGEWGAAPETCPRVVYGHLFSVESTTTQNQSWLVAQGFEPGTHGATLAAAQRMISVGKKALPRVGAAVPLQACGDGWALAATKGHLFCSLPLPDASGLPIHVNGFFNLNTSRTEPMHGQLAGDAAICVEWNRVLAEEAIPAIVEHLFKSVAETVKERDPAGSYAVWPGRDYARSQKAWIREIGNGIVRRLSTLPLVRMRQGETSRWVPAKKARRPGTKWSLALSSALIADGFELVDPHLPQSARENLEDIGALSPYCTRAELRSWLVRDLICSINDAPLQCLRKAEHVIELLDFFLGEKNPQLAGLPLALRQDGTLKTFKDNDTVIVADRPVRELFERWRGWFIDDMLNSLLSGKVLPGTGIFQGTPGQLLTIVEWVLGASSGGAPVPWKPGAQATNDPEWLESVIVFLAASRTLSTSTLQTVPLVPDQMANLHPLYWPTTPAFSRGDLSTADLAALVAFRVPLVHGRPSLVAALQLLAQKLPGRPFPTLAHAIAVRLVGSSATQASHNATDRTTLLSLLARAHNEEPLHVEVMEQLAHAEIWPVEDGRLAAARTKDVYVPAGFDPPKEIGEIGHSVALFKTGPGGRWSSMLRALRAVPFSAAAYVERLFVTLYKGLDPASQRTALEWLATSKVMDDLKQEDSPVSKRALELLREAPLIRCTDGFLHRGCDLYHPDEVSVHTLLGSRAFVPDMAFLGEPKEKWLQLFAHWGIVRTPRPADILHRVYDLTAHATLDGPSSVAAALIALIEHIASRWSVLAEREIDHLKLADHLKDLAWVPALRGAEALRTYGIMKQPDERLYRPDALFTRSCGYLVASQEPLLAVEGIAFDSMFSTIGVRSIVPVSTAIKHFSAIIVASSSTETAIEPTTLAATASSFYRFVATAAQSTGVLPVDIKVLQCQPCIWDTVGSRFMLPHHCFAVAVPFFGSLRAFVQAEGSEAEGLNLLGRRATPAADDFVAFLKDLAAYTSGRGLTVDERDCALYALRQLNALVEVTRKIDDLIILTSDNRLRPASRVLIDDAPWWRERMREGPVALLHESVSPEIARRCQLQGAAEALREVLVADPEPAKSSSVADLCRRFELKVRAPAFEEGLRRLVYQEHQRFDVELTETLDIRFVPSGAIRTALMNSPLSPSLRFGEDDVEVFLADARVFISGGESDVLPLVAEAINRRLGSERLANLAPLEEILRLEPADIERALNRRKVPAVPSTVPSPQLRWEDTMGGTPTFGESAANIASGRQELSDSLADSRISRARPIADPNISSGQQYGSARGTWPAERGGAKCAGVPDTAKFGGDEERSGEVTEKSASDFISNSDFEQSAGPGPQGEVPQSAQVGTTSFREITNRPGARAVPSSTPGDGSTMAYAPRHGPRLRSYLTPPNDATGTESVDDLRMDVGATHAAAIAKAQSYEKRRVGPGVTVEVVGTAGIDFVTRDSRGEADRFIQVRGIDGVWSLEGVGLEARQVKAVRDYEDRFWLYVVEHANDSDRAKVLAIRNPVERATEYRFDGGWRKIAEPDPETISEPSVGLHLYKGKEYIGVIEDVRPADTGDGEAPLLRLGVRTPDAEVKQITFSPSRHLLTREK